MRHLVEFPLQDGGSILVQVDEPAPEGGIVKAASAGEVLEKAEQSFEDALEKLKLGVTTPEEVIRVTSTRN